MSWKCPQCKIELEYLKYNVSTQSREYGTADLESEPTEVQLEQRRRYDIVTDHSSDDYGDTDWDGDPEYECPTCSAGIEISDLEWCEDEEDEELDEDGEPIKVVKEEEPEETKFKIIIPKNYITENNCSGNSLSGTIICKECLHPFVTDTERWGGNNEEFYDCPKCGTQNSSVEFKQLLKDGFFNKITEKKHVTTKKIKPRFLALMGKPKRILHS